MSIALLWRLVWKDTRTLLPVWLAVFGMAVGMQLVCVIGDAAGQSIEADMAMMMTAVFVSLFPLPIAAGAIQFAGETEEETADWLRQLPIPAWWLAATKLATPIVVCLLYYVTATLTGLVLTGFQELPVLSLSDIAGVGILFLWLFACNVFFSLQTRKVIPAAALGLLCAVLLLPLVVDPLLYAMGVDLDHLMICYAIFLVGLILIDLALAVRWARGRPVRPSLHQWLQALPSTNRGFWQPSLEWSVGRGDPVIRSSMVLVWKELRGIAGYLILWGLMGWIIVYGSFLLMNELNGVSILYMLLTPLVAGLMAYMGDQSRETQLFLGQRGISPTLVWITRNTLWFSAAIALVLGWSLWDRYGLHPGEVPMQHARKYVHQSVFRIVDDVRVHYPVFEMRPYPPATAEDVALQISLTGSLLLGCFALGGMCGMWFRRPIVAASAAVAAGVFLFLWHWLALRAGVPLWLTTWPLAIVWFVATGRGSGRWLIARSRWGPQIAWVVVPCILVMVAYPIVRQRQIPTVDVSLAAIEAKHTQRDPQHAEEWEKLLAILREKRDSGSSWVDTPEITQTFVDQLHTIATMPPGRWSLTPEQRLYSGELRASLMGMLGYVDSLGAEGRMLEEMTLYLDLLAVIERIPPLQISHVSWLRQDEMRLLQQIANCANDPECDLETLQYAFETLRMENASRFRLGRIQSFESLLEAAREAEVVVARQLVHQEGDYFELLKEDPSPTGFDRHVPESREPPPPQWLRTIYDWSGEHTRFDRLAAAVLAEPEPGEPISSEDVVAWLRTTPQLTGSGTELEIGEELEWRHWVDFVNREQGRMLESPIREWERALPTAYRQTLIIVALQIHRREHGEFPQHLSQLRTILEREFIVPGDPYAKPREVGPEGDFLWFPRGLDATYIADGDTVVPPGRPLLLSVGYRRGSLRFEGPYANPTAEGVPSAGLYVDASGSSTTAADYLTEPRLDNRTPIVFTIQPGSSDVVAATILEHFWCVGGTNVHWVSPKAEESDANGD